MRCFVDVPYRVVNKKQKTDEQQSKGSQHSSSANDCRSAKCVPRIVGPTFCSSVVDVTNSRITDEHHPMHMHRNAIHQECASDSVADNRHVMRPGRRFMTSRVDRSALRSHVDSALQTAITTAKENKRVFDEIHRRRGILLEIAWRRIYSRGITRRKMDWLDIPSSATYSQIRDIYDAQVKAVGLTKQQLDQVPKHQFPL